MSAAEELAKAKMKRSASTARVTIRRGRPWVCTLAERRNSLGLS